jgi:phospholipid/cholesterol/gamma-HCH transport system substrate-binding protein
METRANFVLIGAFTIAAVVGAFLFVMWIAGYGGHGDRRSIEVVFRGSVSGLTEGALVLFDGIKVGEVSHIAFDKNDPGRVVAKIEIDPNTPIKKDTKARLETQGLTGAAALALTGGAADAPPLEGENGQPPVIAAGGSQLQTIMDNVENLSAKADSVLDQAGKLIADNSESVHETISNAQVFSKALADNAPGVNAALKSVADLGKEIEPLATRLQTLSDDADRVVKSIDPDKVRSIVDNVQGLSGKANTVLDQAEKLIAENSDSIHSTIENADVFAKALGDNASNVDTTLKNLAEVSKTIQPVVARIQTLSDDIDRLVDAVEPEKVRDIVDNVQSLSGKANTVLDRADKLIADNSDSIHSTLTNVDAFSKMLGANTPNVDTTLKNLAEVSKTVQPAVAQIQTLSEDADRLVKAVEPNKVRDIVDNVQSLSGKADTVLDQAGKLLADNSDSIHSVLTNVDAFSKVLSANGPNVDTTLKNLAELSNTVQPVVAQIQTLSQDADRVVKSVEPDQVHAIVVNAETFSRSLADSSNDYRTLVRDGAALATHLNDTSKRLDTALIDVDQFLKAVDSQKIASIVDSANDVMATVRQNRGNIDLTLKNFGELSGKLNDSADKLDGLIASAQSFLGSPGTKGAIDQVSDAAQSVKRLADDVDVRVKEISVGLNRFSNSGLREYEALAIEGRRTIDDVDRVVRSFERNPNQLIFGSKPSLPEYHGGQ